MAHISRTAYLIMAACCALFWSSATLADGYRDRETKAMRDVDQCGPSFLTKHAPASFGNAVSGIFKPACQRHDACYNIKEKSQKWCDDQFGDELLAICARRSRGFVAVCEVRAKIFESLVRTAFGANSYGAPPAGKIRSLRHRVIDSVIGDKEFEVCVAVLNDSKVTQEYDVTLFAENGKRVDREPDSYEVNVEAGQTSRRICVSTTSDLRWSLGNLGRRVFVHVRADTPVGFAVLDDMVTVDVKAVAVPNR